MTIDVNNFAMTADVHNLTVIAVDSVQYCAPILTYFSIVLQENQLF